MKQEERIPNDHWLRNIPIAHRGLHDENLPENSLPAFAAAAEKGYAIELDIRLTADDEIVVIHDDDTGRVAGESVKATQQSLARLRSLRLRESEYGIPTFSEALDVIGGRVPILIEIKSGGNYGRLVRKMNERLRRYGVECAEKDRSAEYAVQSFDPRIIRQVKKIDKGYLTGQLSQDMSKKRIPKWQKWFLAGCYGNAISKPDFISYRFSDLPVGRIERMRQSGMPVLGWTVRSEDDRKAALANCDNIIFEMLRV